MPRAQGVEEQSTEPVGEQRIRELICEALPEGTDLSPLPGFKLDLSANPGFQKVFFSARCDCGTSALLSVEVAGEKTMAEVREALPSLVDRLVKQERAFERMSCELHTRMRMGPSPSRA